MPQNQTLQHIHMSWFCCAVVSTRHAQHVVQALRVCDCAHCSEARLTHGSHLSVCAFTHSHWRSFLRGLPLRCVGEGDSGGFWQRKAPCNRLACWVRTSQLRCVIWSGCSTRRFGYMCCATAPVAKMMGGPMATTLSR